MKKITSLLFVVLLLVGSIGANAVSPTPVAIEEAQEIELTMGTVSVEYTDEGIVLAADLLEKIDVPAEDGQEARLISWQLVGNAKFRLRPNFDHGYADGDWNIKMSNGALIKGVTGRLYINEDWFGPYNPNIVDADVDVYYNVGQLYSSASDTEHMSIDGVGIDITYDTPIIFGWENFHVQGIDTNYFVTNGNVQGKFGDFG